MSKTEVHVPIHEWVESYESEALDRDYHITEDVEEASRAVYECLQLALPKEVLCLSASQIQVVAGAVDEIIHECGIAFRDEKLPKPNQQVLQLMHNIRGLAAKTCQFCTVEDCEFEK